MWSIAFVMTVGVLAGMACTARTTSDTTSRAAPDFTLTDTDGRQVHLADYRGRTVVLYFRFSEGAGCQSCLYQMADIEGQAGAFAAENVVVLPIVMNSADDIRADMVANGVTTPFLIDVDGSVSRAYAALGKGMHPGLPGHSFVLIDTAGTQRWYGEYPSMYLPAAELLEQVRRHRS
jgi:peroxiredoxin